MAHHQALRGSNDKQRATSINSNQSGTNSCPQAFILATDQLSSYRGDEAADSGKSQEPSFGRSSRHLFVRLECQQDCVVRLL